MKGVKRGVAAVVLVAAGVTAGAPPAAADPPSGFPYGCHTVVTGNDRKQGAFSACDGGRGQHRVKITCERAYTPWIQDIVYGPWVDAYSYSEAYCLGIWDIMLTRSSQIRSA